MADQLSFSGKSPVLAALWQEAIHRSPWVEVNEKGIVIEWQKITKLFPKIWRGFHDLPVREWFEANLKMISWEEIIGQDRDPHFYGDREQKKVTGRLFVGSQSFQVVFQEDMLSFIAETSSFLETMDLIRESNLKTLRKKGLGNELLKVDPRPVWSELQQLDTVEYHLIVTFDRSYLNPWKDAAPNSPTLMVKVNSITTELLKKVGRTEVPQGLGSQDFDMIFKQLSEAVSALTHLKPMQRSIEVSVETLIQGEVWEELEFHNKLGKLLLAMRRQADQYGFVLSNYELFHGVDKLFGHYKKFQDRIENSHKSFFEARGYPQLLFFEHYVRIQLEWLFSHTPVLALLYCGIFQVYKKPKHHQMIFGFSPMVMGLQCAKKLSGSTLKLVQREKSADLEDAGSAEYVMTGARLWNAINRVRS